MIRPKVSDIKDALMNHNMVLPPMRPTVLASPILAIPTIRVDTTKGAMIILIRRRKMSVRMEMLLAKALMSASLAAFSR